MFAARSIGIRGLKPSFLFSNSKSSLFKQCRLQSTSTLKKSTELLNNEINLANKMSWESFLNLRKKQRRYGAIGSIAAALLTMAGSFSYFSQIEIDPTETLFGLDIFTVYIGAILCTGFVGFMFGPSLIGDPLFALTNRNLMKTYSIKQKLFLKHVAKMRVDASRQSMNNPVPDYYGEKIGSLKDYRQWLRDCNEYRRKASEFL
jgi:import inner membrane translocase subunit TIM23